MFPTTGVNGSDGLNDNFSSNKRNDRMVNRYNILKYLLPIGIILCGTVLDTSALDQPLTARHLIWCALAIILVVCTKDIKVGAVHFFAFGYLGFALLSYFFAANKSEWLYSVLRIFLAVSYLSFVEIDKKLLSKAMMILGIIFIMYFWWDYSQMGSFARCRGLMRQKNTWAASQFFIIPFCYYAVSQKFWRKLAAGVMAAMIINITLLNSRSAILALIVSAGVLSLKNKKVVLYLVTAATIAMVLNGGEILDSTTLKLRIIQWKPTMKMIVDNPMGVGAGNWAVQFPIYAAGIDYPNAFKKEMFRFPHNDFLWIAAETGIGGITCYVGIFLTALYFAWRTKATYLIIGLAGYMAIACFTAPNERPFPSLMLVTFLAMVDCKKFLVKPCKWMILAVLLFALVVFGFRHRSARWDKKLTRAEEWIRILECTEGYSTYSTLTYTGMPYYWWRGTSNLMLGNKGLATEQYRTAYKHNPGNVHVINGMGIACGMDGDKEAARGYFEEALRICPDMQDAKNNLKKLKYLRGIKNG